MRANKVAFNFLRKRINLRISFDLICLFASEINGKRFCLQIFYDLVRQINKKSPEKKPKKQKKTHCNIL